VTGRVVYRAVLRRNLRQQKMIMTKTSLVSFAETKIKEMIINGELSLGQKLTEDKLAERFSISTTPVHEALKILATIGLVIVKPRSGTYVSSFTRRDIENLNNVRFVIECEAIRESMERNFKLLCDDLSYNILEAKEVQKKGDTKKYIALDKAFHAIFFKHADNQFLNISFASIEARVFTIYNYMIRNYTQEHLEISIRQHQELERAIRNGQFETARERLKEHILRIRNYDPS
jgi:DNA-binding GntR family transcriptional regulator